VAADSSHERAASTAVDNSAMMVGDGPLTGQVADIAVPLLGRVVRYPAPGVCVVVVDGELDMLTAPLLEACVREQLAEVLIHLILDLESVRFLGSSGLSCLLGARELTRQSSGVQLHLAGLVTQAVARPLATIGLLEYFDTYPMDRQGADDQRGYAMAKVNARLTNAGRTQLYPVGWADRPGELPTPRYFARSTLLF
jgi:anti-sigma B factor antagonist